MDLIHKSSQMEKGQEALPDHDFVNLITKSQSILSAYIYCLTTNPHATEDILQELNAQLWEVRGKYDPNRSFIAWAKTLAYYQVLTHRSKKTRSKIVFSEDVMDKLSEEMESPTSTVSDRELLLKECIQALKEKQRTLIELYYTQDMNVNEISQLKNMSVDAVYKTLARVRKALYECVDKKLVKGAVT